MHIKSSTMIMAGTPWGPAQGSGPLNRARGELGNRGVSPAPPQAWGSPQDLICLPPHSSRPSPCLSVSLCPSLSISISLSFSSSLSLPLFLSVSLHLCLSVCLSPCLSLFVSPSLSVSPLPLISLPVSLSTSLSIFQFLSPLPSPARQPLTVVSPGAPCPPAMKSLVEGRLQQWLAPAQGHKDCRSSMDTPLRPSQSRIRSHRAVWPWLGPCPL